MFLWRTDKNYIYQLSSNKPFKNPYSGNRSLCVCVGVGGPYGLSPLWIDTSISSTYLVLNQVGMQKKEVDVRFEKE